jgi:hypothetical protein
MLASNRFWDHLLTKCHTLSQRSKSAKLKVRQQKLGGVKVRDSDRIHVPIQGPILGVDGSCET